MISIETHTNQVNLLNDYIKALEKQISGNKLENEKIQRSYQQNSNHLSFLTTETAKHKAQLSELKNENARLNERLKSLAGIERQHSEAQEKLRASNEEKTRANGQLKKMIDIIKNQEGRIKDKDLQLNEKNTIYRQKLQEIQKLEMANKSLGDHAKEQKKKYQLEIAQAQKIIAQKETLHQNLQKNLDTMTKQFQSESHSLKSASSKMSSELSSRLDQETRQKQSMIEKFQGIRVLQQELQGKVSERDKQISRNNEQRKRLKEQIDRLTQERNELILRNNSSEGNLNENNKALSEAFKKIDLLTKNKGVLETQLQERTHEAGQLSTQIQRLNEQLAGIVLNVQSLKQEKNTLVNSKQSNEGFISILQSSIETANQELNKKKQVLDALEKEVKSFKFSLSEKEKTIVSRNQNIGEKEKMIEGLSQQLIQLQASLTSLQSQKQGLENQLMTAQEKHFKLSGELRTVSQSLAANINEKQAIHKRRYLSDILIQGLNNKIQILDFQFSTCKSTLNTTNSSFAAFKKKTEKEIEDLNNRLAQSLKLNEKKEAKIREMSSELKELEEDLNKRLKNTSLSAQEEIGLEKAKFQRKITQLNLQKNSMVQKKDQELKILKESSRKALQQQKERTKEVAQEAKKKEGEYSKVKLELQNEIFLLKQEVKKVSLDFSLSAQTKEHQEDVMTNLKSITQELQSYTKQQKTHIAQLLELLAQKNRDQEFLEETNQSLRNQVMSLMKNEDELRKQMLELKLRGSASLSSARNSSSINLREKQYKSTFVTGRNARLSGVIQQRRHRDYNKFSKGEQQDSLMRKLQFKESMVKDANNSDVEEEAVFNSILNEHLEN